MAEASDDLNDRLTREFARREKKTEQVTVRPKAELITSDAEQTVSASTPSTRAPSAAEVERDQMGLINRLALDSEINSLLIDLASISTGN